MAFTENGTPSNVFGVHFGTTHITLVKLRYPTSLIEYCDGVRLADYNGSVKKAFKALNKNFREAIVGSNMPNPKLIFTEVHMDTDDNVNAAVRKGAVDGFTKLLRGHVAYDYRVHIDMDDPYTYVAKVEGCLVSDMIDHTDMLEKKFASSTTESEHKALERAFTIMSTEISEHVKYPTVLLIMDDERIRVRYLINNQLRHSEELALGSNWRRLLDNPKVDTSALKSVLTQETRALIESCHSTSEEVLKERVANWFLTPSPISMLIADEIQRIDAPKSLLEMRPNPDKEAAKRADAEGCIIAYGHALGVMNSLGRILV